mgnify:FL=1
MPKQGEILLVPVPYTDLQAVKRRPVLVLSNDHYNTTRNDILVASITSNLTNNEFGVMLEPGDLEDGTLSHASMIRFDKLHCLHQRIIVKRFGRLKREKYKAVVNKIQEFISQDDEGIQHANK